MDKEKLIEILGEMAAKMNDKPHLVFVKTQDMWEAVELAAGLSQVIPGRPPVILAERGCDEPRPLPWREMRTRAMLCLDEHGEMRTMTGQLVVPQHKPIILLARDFQYLPPNDQLAYAHMADGECEPFSLHPGSVLLAAFTPGARLEPSTISRGTVWELESAKQALAAEKK